MTPQTEQTPRSRVVVEELDREFARLHQRSRHFVETVAFEQFYDRPSGFAAPSAGDNVLRSAALIEQTFGGLSANLWDDPFEWTLPEALSTRERVLEYLDEVEATRRRTFLGFTSDTELTRNVLVPSNTLQPLIAVLLEALVGAAEYLGKAVVVIRNC